MRRIDYPLLKSLISAIRSLRALSGRCGSTHGESDARAEEPVLPPFSRNLRLFPGSCTQLRKLVARLGRGGRTWTASIKVNRRRVASGAAAFVPSVHVADDGLVAVTYHDFRSNDAAAGVPTDYWAAHCHANCSTAASWTEETHVAAPFDMEKAPDTERGEFLGDYAGLASVGNAFTPFFAQAAAATDESDLYFARVAP